MTLIPAMKTRLAAPSDLVDLRHIAELKGITVSGRDVTIGAGTTHAEIAQSKEIEAACPACRYHGQAHWRPACAPPGHDRRLGREQRSRRRLSGRAAGAWMPPSSPTSASCRPAQFFTGLFETALEDDEIVTSVSFTAPRQVRLRRSSATPPRAMR